MKSAVPIGIIVFGIGMLVVSGLWASLFPPTARWTDEKAKRSAEVKARLSNIGPLVNSPNPSMHRGPDPATLKAEFDALVIENEELNADFESAANTPKTISRVLKWSGIALAAVGLIGWYAVKQTS